MKEKKGLEWLMDMAILVVKFRREGYKIRSKNQHTPRKSLYFVNRQNAESSKIGHHYRKYIKCFEN